METHDPADRFTSRTVAHVTAQRVNRCSRTSVSHDMQRPHATTEAHTTPDRDRRRAGLALVLAATVLLAACGGGDADEAARPLVDRAHTPEAPSEPEPRPSVRPAPPEATPVVVPDPVPPALSDPLPQPPAPEVPDQPADEAPAPVTLEDGRHFGYLVGYELDSTATAASFDLAQLLTGDDADRAAAEDGVIEPGQEIENDVYIRNANPRLRRALFRDDARITVLDCTNGCTPHAADRATLQNRPLPTPVWLVVEGGVVVAAEEVYLP